MMRAAALLAAASVLAACAPAAATLDAAPRTGLIASGESADAAMLAALVADYEAFRMETDVMFAARRGDLEAAARLPDLSPRALGEAAEAARAFKRRLEAIEARNLSANDRATHAVLAFRVDDMLLEAEFETQRLPFTNDSGFHTTVNFAGLTTRARTVEQAEAWISRLRATPEYLAQNRAWLLYGVETGWTQPAEIVPGVIAQIEALAAEDAETSSFLAPIDALPDTIAEDERIRLRREAVSVVENEVLPAYESLGRFMRETYLPAARDSLGAYALPEGRAYYAALVERFTTLELTPEEIHQRGLAEVDRIRGEMDAVIAETGFQGSFSQFLTFLRTDPRFYAETEFELLAYASYLSKKADDQMPAFFGTLPRLSYGVRPVPAALAPNYTTARYWRGDAEGGVAGAYIVNTYRLDQRPLYEMPALTLHEAVPGHHHQIALTQELEDVPDFRRESGITAFSEGWGLYAEFVGYDMGFYEDPYDRFGALTYEMWRACRLVADTGIHWYGWNRERAEACFLENSALAPLNISSEVSRYISWPGQALAYKTGELLIRELRAEAEAELGADFDIRAFHDAVLAQGAVPLWLLEETMRRWIEDQRAG